MIVLSNSTEQTLAPGQALIFDIVVMHTGPAEYFRPNSGLVGLNAKGIYNCSFNGNAAIGQLAMAMDGSPLAETTMINGADTVANLSANTAVRNICCNRGINIVNTGTTNITVNPNTCFFVKRVA